MTDDSLDAELTRLVETADRLGQAQIPHALRHRIVTFLPVKGWYYRLFTQWDEPDLILKAADVREMAADVRHNIIRLTAEKLTKK